ncbi:nitric-oxide reductase large subunit [Solimonas variicoloris]|uniref:nitric-oxide reductase large subunit n=1 Tax=Solimonas variicoloris TaxID=254408 RepID=UPI0003AA7260|nr:nitric-oxide reductase large subunit [Solimonas variicoloris]
MSGQTSKRLWYGLAIIFVASFATLLWIGREIYVQKPPIPARVVGIDGDTLFTQAQIERGQAVWMAAGGQELGSLWGHGSYVAPDWSADWLHREAIALRDLWARQEGVAGYDTLDPDRQGVLDARLKTEMRRNGYDAASDTLTLAPARAEAVREVARHYAALFGDDAALTALRTQYAMNDGAVADAGDREALAAFVFWTAWAATTNRPGSDISYTSNWPHEPLVGNTPTVGTGMWSVASIILLIAGIAGMVWYHARQQDHGAPAAPSRDPLLGASATPSMKATAKYFLTVIGLFLAQIGLGAITAHYAVEGRAFFGIPLADLLPYTVTRTWHTQLGIYWIATAWLGTGLYIAPLLSGHEPKFQRLGVNLLWLALLVVVVGSCFTGWLTAMHKIGIDRSFWFGSQNLEFTALGRFWQILLFAGLLFWLFLMGRALWPALTRPSESRGLIAMVFISATCIGLFYASSLTWTAHTHYSIIEYWRWWLVHLWVEGFFEVFATAVIALIFTKLGLVRAASANRAVVFSTIVFLFGGILGTLHHLYFTGTPTAVIAFGAVFSALEVVPLSLVGFEAYENYRMTKAQPWVASYRWTILCFVAVAFWNLVGAGLLGFAINPPISLYYVQGLNLTPTHGHAALFGVYGMLGIGLMLFCLRGLTARTAWSEGLLKTTFWSLNIGLAMMVFLSLLPMGIYQAFEAIAHGYWYARSPAVVHSALMERLVWLRVPGDIVFAIGGVALGLFALRLYLGRRQPLPAGTLVGQQA